MKILVLSCSTGGGHNACGHYIEKEFKENNIVCDFVDYFEILGPKAKERSEKIYLDTTKGNGKVFKLAYKLGEAYSKTGITSPVYSFNKLRSISFLFASLDHTSPNNTSSFNSANFGAKSPN